MTDSNTANNIAIATDTDSVTAAPIVADLVVTKSDGVTELLPGSATTYTITVTNQGPDAVTGATLTDHGAGGTDIRQLDVRGDGRLLVRERWCRQSLDRHQPAGWRHRDVLRAGDRRGQCAGVDREYGNRNRPERE